MELIGVVWVLYQFDFRFGLDTTWFHSTHTLCQTVLLAPTPQAHCLCSGVLFELCVFVQI